MHIEVTTASTVAGIAAGQLLVDMSNSTYPKRPANCCIWRSPSPIICGEKSVRIATLRGYSSRIPLAAAPVPAPRSRKVKASCSPKGRSSPMNCHCAARFCSRSAVLAVQYWAPSSDFQMAAFVSVDWSMSRRLVAVILRATLV